MGRKYMDLEGSFQPPPRAFHPHHLKSGAPIPGRHQVGVAPTCMAFTQGGKMGAEALAVEVAGHPSIPIGLCLAAPPHGWRRRDGLNPCHTFVPRLCTR